MRRWFALATVLFVGVGCSADRPSRAEDATGAAMERELPRELDDGSYSCCQTTGEMDPLTPLKLTPS